MTKFLLLLLFSLSGLMLKAQTMTFCTKINKEDQCAEKPKHFYIEYGKGAHIYALVNLLEEVNTVKVYYKIYYLDKYNEEVYMTTLSQDVLPKWKTFWKQFVFTQEMSYKIYLYDDKDKLLTSNAIFVEADYEY
jgi:hypothetical protein